MEDPHAARMLNVRPQRLSEEQGRAYIASFDSDLSHLFGMFAKPYDRPGGITMIASTRRRRGG